MIIEICLKLINLKIKDLVLEITVLNKKKMNHMQLEKKLKDYKKENKLYLI
jgi:hypothetical protein